MDEECGDAMSSAPVARLFYCFGSVKLEGVFRYRNIIG